MTPENRESPDASRGTVVCTIVSKNYLAQARALMDSLATLHDDLKLVTLLVDRVDGKFDPSGETFETWLASELGIPKWEHFSMKYDIMELNTAVKPYLLEALADRFQPANIIYLDPDIVVYRRIDALLAELERHDVVLTPHILAPIDDGKRPSELDFLQVGSYNLGFFALARRGHWRELVHWWQEKVYRDCTSELERGVFVDQHWIDLVPSLFDRVRIFRDPGHNVAYWNFKTRDVQPCESGYLVNGSPLVFMHFSGFSVDDIERVSKHQTRFVLSDLNAHYRALFEDYRERLLAHGFQTTREWPYAYGAFEDGVPISNTLRACLRKNDPVGERWPNPFDVSDENSFRRWATTPGTEGHWQLLSPYLLTLHDLQPDLQSRYTLRHIVRDVAKWFERDFARWFVRQERTTPVFHAVYVAPIKEALDRSERSHPSTKASVSEGGADRVSFWNRCSTTFRYFRDYPREIAPFVHPLSIDIAPTIYTGPGGVYGWFRKTLMGFGLQQRIKKLLGMRLLLTMRFFFSYPDPGDEGSQGLPALPTPTGMRESSSASARGALSRGVNVAGYTRSETGVGQVARSLLGCLEGSGYPVAKLAIAAHDVSRKEDRSTDHVEEGLPHPITVFNVNADSTEPIGALLGSGAYEGRYNIGYWFWELSQFPDRWQPAFAPYDEIWVASSFTHAAVAARSPVPVVRVPVSVQVDLPEATRRAELGLPDDAFIVLYVLDALSILERKNPWGAVGMFEKAFNDAERERDVRLVIKVTNLDRASEEDRRRLRDELARVNGILIDRYLDRLDVNALLHHCDVYLSPHRSEGFGLTIAEAMYLGKPVVATAYSANMDFMTPSNSYFIPYDLVALEKDYPPYDQGSVWADPDCEAGARLLHQVYENPVEARQRGAVAAADIRRHYAPRVVAQEIIARLELVRARMTAECEEGK